MRTTIAAKRDMLVITNIRHYEDIVALLSYVGQALSGEKAKKPQYFSGLVPDKMGENQVVQ
jgi:hypothetical protein